ncbi:MAG: endonuclease/exonuclease/phosphatase family protein [Planctomycetota bacterium]
MKDLCLVFLLVLSLLVFSGTPVNAQWNPFMGEWGRSGPRDLRIMTWNVEDGLCSSNDKTEGANNWTALALVISALKPDVLLIQEAGDNSGNGTGSYNDSVSDLSLTMDLFFNGGMDPYHGYSEVTAYIKKYAPSYDLPYLFVSVEGDGYNRNLIVSRFPFMDLNGDMQSTLSDIAYVIPDAYAPGGHGGIRGIQFAEIDVPRFFSSGDLVVGNCHLKAGSSSWDMQMRLDAAKNTAYYVDHLFNGAGEGIPDPYNTIIDYPPAATILFPLTPVIIGGDFNEDESYNDRDGPVLWVARAQYDQGSGNDGTDRDRSDSVFDSAVHPITGARSTIGSTETKFDYLILQDSIVTLVRAYVFDSTDLDPNVLPPEVNLFFIPEMISAAASDHKPVIIDLQLPETNAIPLMEKDQAGRINNAEFVYSAE